MCTWAGHRSVPHVERSRAAAAVSLHFDAPAQISDVPKVDAASLPPHVDGTRVECAASKGKEISLSCNTTNAFNIPLEYPQDHWSNSDRSV